MASKKALQVIDNAMYFDGYRTLTHNCLFNFIVGNRGAGKSFWSKKYCIKGWFKDKKEFIYVRRFDTEFETLDTYFDDIIKLDIFPEEEYSTMDFDDEGNRKPMFQVKGHDLIINGDVAGHAIALTTSASKKSTPFPNVDKIIFDEFIIELGSTGNYYLKAEVRKFLDLYETINRLRINEPDTIVFFLSNAVTMTNPYFLYFDMVLPYGKNIITKNDKLLQMVANEDFIKLKKASRFGQLIKGTPYEDYAVNNKFLLDNDDFIAKKTGQSQYRFSLKYNGTVYGVWVDFHVGRFYVSENLDKYCKLVYVITMEDHTENTFLTKSLGTNSLYKQFLEAYKISVVYYESIKIKNIIHEIIRKTMF